MQLRLFLATLLAGATLAPAQPTRTLKDTFQGDFRIGAALNQAQFEERDTVGAGIAAAQFNTITPENILKWGLVHPQEAIYRFDAPDHYVAFGEKHHMFVVGHCLVWHQQTPAWVFQDAQGAPLTRDALLARLRDHIQTVVGRYKGRIGGWDVVNEALNEDGSMRQTPWLKIIGEDYLAKAFEYAHAADPAAELYYNDYALERPAKRAGAVKLIRNLQAAGVTVTAVGLQGHDSLTWPTVDEQESTIVAFQQLGVKVNITELDVDMLPRATREPTADVSVSVEAKAQLDPYKEGLPMAQQQALGRRYFDLFGVFYKHRDAITRITFWGVTDGSSWLNNYPVRGRTNYPLLFDRQGQTKLAFLQVVGIKARAVTEQDHRRLMETLHIQALRPGANGSNKDAPNYANYDEAKANPYPKLPDPLQLKNGRKVTTAAMWWEQRRPEIVEEFDREIYGRVPKIMPAVKWEVTNTQNTEVLGTPVVMKQLVGHVDNREYPAISVEIRMTLTTPAQAAGKAPVIVELGAAAGGGRPAPNQPNGPDWRQQVLAKGWGYAQFSVYSVQEDNGAGLLQGIIGLVNHGQPRKPEDWGALRAWAWGASQALDYFETDPAVDAKRVAVEGHSRFGKAALVAMAYDPRFANAYVSSSGEGGAKIHRRNWGELVENVGGSGEYHWMAGNFLKYAGPLTWDDLPVDSHELVALCAPRPVFIGAGATNGDGWADAKGMFQAAAGAGPVYRLLGKKDLGTTEFPPIETGLMEGEIAFRQHSGGHTPMPNWPTFLSFAARYWGGQ